MIKPEDTSTIDAKRLVTINLKYSSAAKPLRTMAFAQLAAKILYLSGEPLALPEVSARIAKVLGVPQLAHSSVERGLRYLLEIKQVTEHNARWSLTSHATKTIAADIAESTNRVDGVLLRHFPADVRDESARTWFSEASAVVFGRYGDEWVANLCKGARVMLPAFQPLSELLEPIARKHGYGDRAQAMVNGYLAFVSSQHADDHNCLMGLGQAMFSARLVTADVGADPITLQEFRDAKIVFDTNVLFAIVLEDHRLAKSIAALGRALQGLGVIPVYLQPSHEEYTAAVRFKRDRIVEAAGKYSEEILLGVRDDFVATAYNRGCRSPEDFDRFFDSIMKLPNEIKNGPQLVLLEDDEIAKAIEAASQDANLKAQLETLSRQFRPKWRRPKGARSVAHDAVLIRCAERERELGTKCWVLSLDRSLTACALQRSGPHSLPVVLSADALIEILALHGTGPDIEAHDFAPLLARIILNQCEPPTNTYTIEDLHLLSSVNEAAADLPPQDTKELALLVARARVAGKTADDASLQLEVNRRFQQKRMATEDAVREAKDRVRRVEQDMQAERATREHAERELEHERIERKKAEAGKRLVIGLLWRVPVAIAVAAVLFLLGHWLVPANDKRQLVQYGLGILGFAGSAWKVVWEQIALYRREITGLVSLSTKQTGSGHAR